MARDLYRELPRHWADLERAESLCQRALRPRPRGFEIKDTEARILSRQLLKLGRVANGAGEHIMAHSFFECAYGARTENIACLIAATNMRLKLGQLRLAAFIYSRLLSDWTAWGLTEDQRAMVERKGAEAAAAIARRERLPHGAIVKEEDEVAQLLANRYASVLDFGCEGGSGEASVEAATEWSDLTYLLRRHGHAANAAGDVEAAQQWFDCAFAVGRKPSDLLSAANMRGKLVEGCVAAEALYYHLLTTELPEPLAEHEEEIANRKLDQLLEGRKAKAEAEYKRLYEEADDDEWEALRAKVAAAALGLVGDLTELDETVMLPMLPAVASSIDDDDELWVDAAEEAAAALADEEDDEKVTNSPEQPAAEAPKGDELRRLASAASDLRQQAAAMRELAEERAAMAAEDVRLNTVPLDSPPPLKEEARRRPVPLVDVKAMEQMLWEKEHGDAWREKLKAEPESKEQSSWHEV